MLLRDMTAHVPVLATEAIGLLDPQPGDTVVDCTFGAGGHSRLLADRIGADGTLIAIDRDPDAERHFDDFAAEAACHARFIRASFVEGLALLLDEGVRADGVLMDLGISSMQVDTRERGFAYAYDAPLAMRMDPTQDLDAREIVNTWEQRRIAQVLRTLGEERHAARIAAGIVRARERAPIETTTELVDVIAAAVPAPARFAGGHPAKRSFQAIRIAVNAELDQLDEVLPLAWELLRVGARFAGISFHSLEDRRVKHFLADRAQGCICPPELPVCACDREPAAALLSRRSIQPSAAEIADNPRARSARLRGARKLREGM
jgi:16S rRNA (cytosine1402-N4)-methyltransferase